MCEARAIGCRLQAIGSEREPLARAPLSHVWPTAYSLQPIASSQRGVTLVELVISIVIIAISVAAIMGVLTMLSTGSAEAMVRNQAVAIAAAYLEEIRLKDFTANGVPGSRALYDDIADYNGLTDVGARDQFGSPIVGLESYTVRVTVGAGVLGAVPAASVRRIDVNVQHSAGVNMTLSAYKAAL